MRRVGVVVAWVAIVVVASALTWRAIDTAGSQILSEPYQPSLSGTTDEIGVPVETHKPKPTKKPTKKPAKKPTKTSSSQPQQSPTATRTASPQPTSVARTWKGAAGSMEARCTGARITLVSATPNNGYRAEIESEDSDRIAVHFEPKSDSGIETTVRAECDGGVPTFKVETESSSD